MDRNKKICEATVHNKTLTSRIKSGFVRVWKFITGYSKIYLLFDKNQKDFPSEIHIRIWNLGIHVLPLDLTLPSEVRNNLPEYLVRSCEQMQQYLIYLLSDMYENIEKYLPLPTGEHDMTNKVLRPFVDLCLLGEADEACLIIDQSSLEKYIKKLRNSKYFSDDKKSGISIEQRFKILERTGLEIHYNENKVLITNSIYPNMFYAMCELAKATSGEKAAGDNSFTYCDFRKLCKDYKYDKYENALVFLSDEQLQIARELDLIAKKNKFTRSIKTGHCPGHEVIYKYKKTKVLMLNCLRNNIRLAIQIPFDKKDLSTINDFFTSIENDSPELTKFVVRRLHYCGNCKGDKSCGYPMVICGRTRKLCWHWMNVVRLETELLSDEVSFIEKILLYIRNSANFQI